MVEKKLRKSNRVFVVVTVFLLQCGVAIGDGSAQLNSEFESHIRPVLVSKCVKCHGEKKQEGELRLDTREGMLKGGESGPAIVPGKPDKSLLIEAIRYESIEMPPDNPLTSQQVRAFANWIKNDAAWPKAEQLRPFSGITEEDRTWWAFQPIATPSVPNVNSDWPRNEIDAFILHRMAEAKLRPSPRADRRTLVRRLYFDLIGLPPSPEEIKQFIDDESPDAWARLVDRLLDDRRYGEHWARYWLDLVRYAESDGWNQDAYRDNIWRYRDYVVDSFNNDIPFPQFVREQIAGDEIPDDDPRRLAATGFLRLGIYEYNQRDARTHWNSIINEITDVTGDVFLGMGMACAKCHDHKFDPILQEDYFRLRSFFEPLIWRDDVVGATQQQIAEYQKELSEWESATKEIRAKIDELVKPYHEKKWKSTVDKFPVDIQQCFHKPVEERNSWEHQMAYLVSRQFLEEGGGPLKNMSKADKTAHGELLTELKKLDHLKPKPLPALMSVTDFNGPCSATVIPDNPDESIAPGFLQVLSQQSRPSVTIPPLENSTGRRTALANWIGSEDNPLAARVYVNRIWQHHFGRGIVATPNDFGHKGQPPTHPLLLDWLARRFIDHGWSTKHMHKLIVTSQTWMQSTEHPQAESHEKADPGKELYWRAPVRRLHAEQIRDAMLSVSGELESRMGGPSEAETSHRRALYLKRFRNTPIAMLNLFDVANGLKSVAIRSRTTTPTQALLMINGKYSLARARKMAERVLAVSSDVDENIRHAIELTWGRPPTDEEASLGRSYVCRVRENADASSEMDRERFAEFCHVLINSNEFLYVD